MSNIMNHMQAARAISDIKDALREIGCDVSCTDGLGDVADIIRKECLAGPVVNATLESGPGIKVLPVGKKGYKISATSGAMIESDLTSELPKGTSIQKVLHHVLYSAIPSAAKAAAAAPAIVKIDLIKMSYDGIDYYENPAFGAKGQGRRSGLVPNSWYIRLFTHHMKEPFYLDLGPLATAITTDIMSEITRLVDCKVMNAIENHMQAEHSHHDHCHCDGHHHGHHHGHPEDPIDPGFLICPVCGKPQNLCTCGHCDGHHHGHCGGHHDHCPHPTGPCSHPIDANNNGICDVCGWPTSEHGCPKPPVKPCNCPTDRNLDGVCDNCGLPMSLHTTAPDFNLNDLNGDGLCDDCGLPLAKEQSKTQEEIELEKYLSGK